MRPLLATDRINLGFWLNISFVINYRGAFRSTVVIAIDLLTSEDGLFSLNHSGASAATVFTIPTTFGIVHAQSYTGVEQATQSVTQVVSSLLDAFTVPPTHYVLKIVFTFSPICHAYTNLIAIYLIIMKDLIFSQHRPPAIRHFFLSVVIAGDCAMTWAFYVLHKICRIKIS